MSCTDETIIMCKYWTKKGSKTATNTIRNTKRSDYSFVRSIHTLAGEWKKKRSVLGFLCARTLHTIWNRKRRLSTPNHNTQSHATIKTAGRDANDSTIAYTHVCTNIRWLRENKRERETHTNIQTSSETCSILLMNKRWCSAFLMLNEIMH